MHVDVCVANDAYEVAQSVLPRSRIAACRQTCVPGAAVPQSEALVTYLPDVTIVRSPDSHITYLRILITSS